MNWDQIKGNWKQFKGNARTQWGKLTDDELDQIDGHREVLVGKIQERYGINKEEADRQVKDFEGRL
ncbi:MAG: CsbD family protein [Nitrococcus sp.]|nr:CsbD family protein [Nitrococcus sp.]